MTWCRPWPRSSCSSSIIWRRVLHIMEWWFPSTLPAFMISAEDVPVELQITHLPLIPLIIAHQLCGQFRGYSLEFCCSRPMLGKQTIFRWITCRKSASSHLVQSWARSGGWRYATWHDLWDLWGIQRIHLSYPCLKQHIDQEFSADKRHFLSKCGVFERW